MADDVTGLLWVDEKSLLFSSSPIYGKPGIFEVMCGREQPALKMLVGPKNIRPAYPDGADYFELKEARGRHVRFYYGADVDRIDFNDFRSEEYLRTVALPP